MEKTEEWEEPIDYDEDTREKCCLHADDKPRVGFECPSTRNLLTRIVGNRLRCSGHLVDKALPSSLSQNPPSVSLISATQRMPHDPRAELPSAWG